MNEDDKARLEKAKIRIHQQPLSLVDLNDVMWLFDLVETQDFKVSNLTTERDVAWQEIKRLHGAYSEELKHCSEGNIKIAELKVKVEKLRHAIEVQLTYTPNLMRLEKALADTKEE